MTSYGINPQASLMHPCSHELGQTLALGHGGVRHRSLGLCLDANYGFPTFSEFSGTLKISSAPGWTNGAVIIRY